MAFSRDAAVERQELGEQVGAPRGRHRLLAPVELVNRDVNVRPRLRIPILASRSRNEVTPAHQGVQALGLTRRECRFILRRFRCRTGAHRRLDGDGSRCTGGSGTRGIGRVRRAAARLGASVPPDVSPALLRTTAALGASRVVASPGLAVTMSSSETASSAPEVPALAA